MLKYHNYDFRLISVANGNVLEREVFVPIRIRICAAGIKGRVHLLNFETSPDHRLIAYNEFNDADKLMRIIFWTIYSAFGSLVDIFTQIHSEHGLEIRQD